MTLYEKIVNGEEKISLVGLGYVGMPIAVEFAKHIKVIGFDINEKRINEYANGIDATNEVGAAIKDTTVEFTADPKKLKEAKFIVVAVPSSDCCNCFHLISSSKYYRFNTNSCTGLPNPSVKRPGLKPSF